jgi:hypothetical protein
MTAFNVVRFRVKAGSEDEFESVYANLKRDFAGLRNIALVRNAPNDEGDADSGFTKYFAVGEWESFEDIRNARPRMGGNLDQFRHTLVPDGKAVTDAISGEAIYETRATR